MQNRKVVNLADHRADDDGIIRPNETVKEYMERAEMARQRVGKVWEYHIDMGQALWQFHLQLEAKIRPNDPDQRPQDTQRWRDSMSAFLRSTHLHEDDPGSPWTKAERTNLMKIMERLPEVNEFRAAFAKSEGEKKLQRLNNPSHVWRKFLEWKGETKAKAQEQSKLDVLQAEMVRLIGVLDTVCDHLHVDNTAGYEPLLERVARFDGENFTAVPTEEQEREVAAKNILEDELEKAQAGLMNTTGELEKLRAQRERQAVSLSSVIALLNAFVAGDNPLDEAKVFLDNLHPPQPESYWSDLWDQQQAANDAAPEPTEAVTEPETTDSREEVLAATQELHRKGLVEPVEPIQEGQDPYTVRWRVTGKPAEEVAAEPPTEVKEPPPTEAVTEIEPTEAVTEMERIREVVRAYYREHVRGDKHRDDWDAAIIRNELSADHGIEISKSNIKTIFIRKIVPKPRGRKKKAAVV